MRLYFPAEKPLDHGADPGAAGKDSGIKYSVPEKRRFIDCVAHAPTANVERELITSMQRVYAGYFDSLCTQNKL